MEDGLIRLPFDQEALDQGMRRVGQLHAQAQIVNWAVLRLIGLEVVSEPDGLGCFMLERLCIGGSKNLIRVFSPAWYASCGLVRTFELPRPKLVETPVMISPNQSYITINIHKLLQKSLQIDLVCKPLRDDVYGPRW